jgi:hypothetical protein
VTVGSEFYVCPGSKMRRTAKKERSLKASFFFYPSRQAWHIISRRLYIIKGGKPPLYLITPLGVHTVGLMIYKTSF